jgi:hypothetical protein
MPVLMAISEGLCAVLAWFNLFKGHYRVARLQRSAR